MKQYALILLFVLISSPILGQTEIEAKELTKKEIRALKKKSIRKTKRTL